MTQSGNKKERYQVIAQVVSMILGIGCNHPLRVAIDGVDAAGKTSLADEIAESIELSGRKVIRASVDGFHNPKSIRYHLGENSPEGYYQDSFNYQALVKGLLEPLGFRGNRQYICSVYDYLSEKAVHETYKFAAIDAILLFDGIFLLRPELIQYWDFSIFVDVDFSISLARAINRFIASGESDSGVDLLKSRYDVRYIPGQNIYLNEANPQKYANIIFDNNDIQHPKIIMN